MIELEHYSHEEALERLVNIYLKNKKFWNETKFIRPTFNALSSIFKIVDWADENKLFITMVDFEEIGGFIINIRKSHTNHVSVRAFNKMDLFCAGIESHFNFHIITIDKYFSDNTKQAILDYLK